ncbi:antibiotic biosynthesis monooxygenase family protein, partial [Loktanella salsilacus]|uniref:antibiotic biosynthesis monooxygenase family protein n=1 Tax=Loktanella salsilacus TaxID=195913 RepID=UPI003569B263
VTTLINTFVVAPELQQELIDLLTDATTDVMRHLDGFVSANLHKSLDGNHVANYAQWENQAALGAAMKNPDVQASLKQAADIAISITPVLYQAVHSESTN